MLCSYFMSSLISQAGGTTCTLRLRPSIGVIDPPSSIIAALDATLTIHLPVDEVPLPLAILLALYSLHHPLTFLPAMAAPSKATHLRVTLSRAIHPLNNRATTNKAHLCNTNKVLLNKSL